MPKTQGNIRKGRKLRRLVLGTIAALLVAGVGLIAYMRIEASVVHLQYADVQLEDLPAAFDGFTVLFASDLHIDAQNPPERAFALVRQLAALQPDVVLLGGDYTSYGIGNALTLRFGRGTFQEGKVRETALRDRFFLMMRDVQPPYGKFGAAGNHDNLTDGLEESMALGGVRLIRDDVAVIEKQGEKLYIAGLDDWTTGQQRVRRLAQSVKGGNCVILLSHNPDALPIVSNEPASDGLQWADLMLSGHTHGGQIRPFGRTIVSVTEYGDRYRTGWRWESGTELLVSNGVGTTGVPLRLGAPAQAHLITLRRAPKQTELPD